jgi:hypothetical protein
MDKRDVEQQKSHGQEQALRRMTIYLHIPLPDDDHSRNRERYRTV